MEEEEEKEEKGLASTCRLCTRALPSASSFSPWHKHRGQSRLTSRYRGTAQGPYSQLHTSAAALARRNTQPPLLRAQSWMLLIPAVFRD